MHPDNTANFRAPGIADPELAHLYRTRMPHPVARAYYQWECAAPGTHSELHAAFGFYESLLWTAAVVTVAKYLAGLPDDTARRAALERPEKLGLWLRKPTLAYLQATIGHCAAAADQAESDQRRLGSDGLRALAPDGNREFVSVLETEAASVRLARNSLYHGQFLALEPDCVLPGLREDLCQIAQGARWLGERCSVARIRKEGSSILVWPFVGTNGEQRPLSIHANNLTFPAGAEGDVCVSIDAQGHLTLLAPLVHATKGGWRIAWQMEGPQRWRYVDYREGGQQLSESAEDIADTALTLPVSLGRLDLSLDQLAMTPRDAARNPAWLTRYLVDLNPFGQGGQGELFWARDRLLDRPCVVKRIRRAAESGLASPDKFFREAQLLARVRNPHVVAVYDVVIDHANLPAMILERVPGITLEAYVRAAGGKLDAQTADNLFRQLCAAVNAVHAVDVVHRDLSPSNILVVTDADLDNDDDRKRWAACPKPHVVVVDFGLARPVHASAVTRVAGAGHHYYTAREVFLGVDVPANARPRADVFSLAKILNFMVSGGRGKWRGDAVRQQWYEEATDDEYETRTPSVDALLSTLPPLPAKVEVPGGPAPTQPAAETTGPKATQRQPAAANPAPPSRPTPASDPVEPSQTPPPRNGAVGSVFSMAAVGLAAAVANSWKSLDAAPALPEKAVAADVPVPTRPTGNPTAPLPSKNQAPPAIPSAQAPQAPADEAARPPPQAPAGKNATFGTAWSVATRWSVHRLVATEKVFAAIPNPATQAKTVEVIYTLLDGGDELAPVRRKSNELAESWSAVTLADAGVLYGSTIAGQIVRMGAPYAHNEKVMRCPNFTSHIAAGRAWGDHWLAMASMEGVHAHLWLARLPVVQHEMPKPVIWLPGQTIAHLQFGDGGLHVLTTDGQWSVLALEGQWWQSPPNVLRRSTTESVCAVALAADCRAAAVATQHQIVVTAPALGIHHGALAAPATRRLAFVPDATNGSAVPRFVSVDRSGNVWLWSANDPQPMRLGQAEGVTALAATRRWAVVGTASELLGFRIA
ncbi:MAG: protein kinase [Deltaproteobacteria bacterium]|nr:protein kinase [Deltaproteobacteria bacterium]